MVKRLDTILCQVSDMDRATAFYRGVLGLPPGVQSAYWSDFDLGGVKIGLHPPFAGGSCSPGGGWILGIEVDDLLGLRGALEKVGAKVGTYHDVPGGVLMDFQDPDGNNLQAIQRGVTAATLSGS
jgi:catechol 2,3-dioxygenase-like lactoylglutathione lyase family enzyme